ncbi:MAG: hypothetical protein R3C44_02675 [Chloroflexota bacterium]
MDSMDLDDGIKGELLRVALPDYLFTEELFATLTPPKKPNLIGIYQLFLHGDFVNDLNDSDLPAALEWLLNHMNYDHDSENPFIIVRDKLILRAWDAMETPGVLEAFAKWYQTGCYTFVQSSANPQ